VGGIIKWAVDRMAARRAPERRAKVEETGVLLASGLIAGEALMGIVLAVTFLSGISSFTHLLTGADEFAFFKTWGGWLSYVGFAAVAWVLIRIPLVVKMTPLETPPSETGLSEPRTSESGSL
jgi:hypothetical protein